jgi:L-lactate dehydrogenase complex protein LldG
MRPTLVRGNPRVAEMTATDSSSSATLLWQHFASKAAAIGASVELAATETTAADVILRAAGAPACTGTLAERFPGVAERCAGRATAGEPTATDVVAAVPLAVAETGSVVLAETDTDRGACFLAEHLWLLVAADQIVPSLDAALERVRQLVHAGNHYVTLMSGPSRTADIERTLTVGVHGPRALTIVIVGEETG